MRLIPTFDTYHEDWHCAGFTLELTNTRKISQNKIYSEGNLKFEMENDHLFLFYGGYTWSIIELIGSI